MLLDEWVRGDQNALDRLTPLVYPQLHSLASALLRRGGRPDSLETTVLVNELFLKLLARRPAKLESRRHFYALSAKMIRHALIDHCRQNLASKRGGHAQRVPLHEDLIWVDAAGPDMLGLGTAMAELERLDRQQAEIFDMRFVLGLTAEETAELTGLSKATVDRKIRTARAWLFQRLQADAKSEPSTHT